MRLNLQIFVLTLLSQVGMNSLWNANPILKLRVHRDRVGLVGLEAAY